MAININPIDPKVIQSHLEKALFYYDLPGLAVGLSLGPGKLGPDKSRPGENGNFTFALGMQNAIDGLPLRTHHIFHMASVSKLFVGTSILQLWEKDLIALPGLLTDYLPDFEMADERYKTITIEQMLSHTSGMPDVQDYRWYDSETDEGALSRYIHSDEVKNARLLWAPGEGGFAYSNIAYEILGHIISEISGLSFEEYVEENIFKAAGMKDSDLLTFRRDKATLASPHGKDENNHFKIVEHYPYNRAHGPSSTLTSTTEDMNTFAQEYMAGKLLGPQAMERAWEEHGLVQNNQERICLSWFKREQNNYTLYGHEGTDDGFRSSFWLCPELNVSITVCSNLSGAPTKRINREIFDILLAIL